MIRIRKHGLAGHGPESEPAPGNGENPLFGHSFTSKPAIFLIVVAVWMWVHGSAFALQAKRAPRRPRAAETSIAAVPTGDTIRISYPDSVNLAVFVDYVSQALDLKIAYADEIKSQTVVVRPGEFSVPRAQLLDLLRSMLRMRDLALVEGDLDGWLRVVASSDARRHIAGIREDAPSLLESNSNRIVTQVVHLVSSDAATVIKHARDFLSSKASVIEVAGGKTLIITDYESALVRALDIIHLIDVPPNTIGVVSVPVVHYDAETLSTHISGILAEKAKLEGTGGSTVSIRTDLSNQTILLVGPETDLAKAQALLEQFDVPQATHRETRAYAPRFISADRLQRLIENVIGPGGVTSGGARLFLDEDTNRLYVTASHDLHAQIDHLLREEDVEAVESVRPMRIYTPMNRSASDLIGTLAEVLPNVLTTSTIEESTPARESAQKGPPGPNRPPVTPGAGRALPIPPAVGDREESPPNQDVARIGRIEGADFVLSHDEHTNSIIAIGPREFHRRLQDLLDVLDKRQPQVLIEMTLVAVTFNDSFSIGIELANEERLGDFQSLLFSSFGLSGIGLATGSRTFNPGGGVNWILMGPHETPILLRAIAAHGNSRIVATLKVVVSNNTSATISSVEEAPFTSVNASDTVATTSFAGFESAGTTLTATPRIGQGDHLELKYSLNFSNFTGAGTSGVPPPRTTNSFTGTVVIPDGHTIVLGGLTTENEVDSVTEVPILGRLPIVGPLFQTSDRSRSKTRVFAFIRPTILRDDKFADLNFISENELERAQLVAKEHPPDELLWMR